MKIIATIAFVTALFPGLAQAKTFDDMFPTAERVTNPDYMWVQDLLDGMDFQQGEVTVGDGLAKMDVPEAYYFLGPKDATATLADIWGNPESSATLGMVFPSDLSPLDARWGVEVTFDPIGYVEDADKEDIDAAELLSTLREDLAGENEWRVENGYETITLVGWASAPFYDESSNALHWAKHLRFGESEEGTLNYQLRILGRKGTLNLNIIGPINDLPAAQAAIPDLIAMTEFTEGNRYIDFDPELDEVAAYGLGGLIAGKALSKLGFLAAALAFLKKGGFLLLLPLIWVYNRLAGKGRSKAD